MVDCSRQANTAIEALKDDCKTLSATYEAQNPQSTKGGTLTFHQFLESMRAAKSGSKLWKAGWTFGPWSDVQVEVPVVDKKTGQCYGTKAQTWAACPRCAVGVETKRIVAQCRMDGDAHGVFVRGCENCGLFDMRMFDDSIC